MPSKTDFIKLTAVFKSALPLAPADSYACGTFQSSSASLTRRAFARNSEADRGDEIVQLELFLGVWIWAACDDVREHFAQTRMVARWARVVVADKFIFSNKKE
jgi:hypothetical protein